MPDPPHSNVKIYDRPEKKRPPLLMLILGILVGLVVVFFLYKTFVHPAESTPSTGVNRAAPGMLPTSSLLSPNGRLQ